MALLLFARTESCRARGSAVSCTKAFGRGMAGEIVVRMPSLAGSRLRVSAVAGALLLAGCSSWAPSWDWVPSMSSFTRAANVSLTIESDPPGADARTSLGATCRTPCMIPVPADREFTVTYALNGYLPQSVTVVPRSPDMTTPEPGAPPPAADLAPNPVYAQLQPAPPPPMTRKGRGRVVKAKKKKQPPPQQQQ